MRDRGGRIVRRFAYPDSMMIERSVPGGLYCHYAWIGAAADARVLRHWIEDGEAYDLRYDLVGECIDVQHNNGAQITSQHQAAFNIIMERAPVFSDGENMQIYDLRATAEANGDIISFHGDKSGRFREYFVRNKGDGKFLKYITPRVWAQDFLIPEIILQTDYLEADLSIPIFSNKATGILKKEMPQDLEFYPLKIEANEMEIDFFICKVKTYTHLIDETNSEYRPLTGSLPIITNEVYYASFSKEFYIARDVKNPSTFVVSEKFLKICIDNELKINFTKLMQSNLAAPSDN